MTKHQKEIMDALEEKGAYILVYMTRLDMRSVLIIPNKVDKTIRFDTFLNLQHQGLVENISKKNPFNDWDGKWAKK